MYIRISKVRQAESEFITEAKTIPYGPQAKGLLSRGWAIHAYIP